MTKFRRIFLSSLFLFASLMRMGAQQADSTLLQAKLDEYLLAIDHLGIKEAEAEVDFMISSVLDSARRSMAAERAFEHFRDSKVMGSENVAVHIYDNWFANYRVVFDDIEKLDAAEFFAFINRRSLVGKIAQEVRFVSSESDTLSFPRKGRKTILYFFSTGCPLCMYTSLAMTRLLNEGKYNIDVVTAYVGDDLNAWQEYLVQKLRIKNTCRTKVYNVLPADDDFVGAYSVIQTPRMFLIDADGTIIGRDLDAEALEKLL